MNTKRNMINIIRVISGNYYFRFIWYLLEVIFRNVLKIKEKKTTHSKKTEKIIQDLFGTKCIDINFSL